MRTLRFFAVPLSFLIGMSPVSRLTAQGRETASRPADISAFGAFSNSQPDYGAVRNNGVTLGADYTRFFARIPIAPSLELRANVLDGSVVHELTYLGGLRATLPLRGKFRPYADALIGFGTIHYAVAPLPGYTGDRSTVYSYGGGLDTRVTANFDLMLDAQYQSWNFGGYPGPAQYTLTPSVFSAGVVYHIPFTSRKQSGPRVLVP
jgi:hypothetical protein